MTVFPTPANANCSQKLLGSARFQHLKTQPPHLPVAALSHVASAVSTKMVGAGSAVPYDVMARVANSGWHIPVDEAGAPDLIHIDDR
jgi:hypothetical protein